mmetsp:Transcript_62158/g.116285  ORF Transcript_62158/g.116285 Transcript_62158/m.116285 type:complete len:405 (-) Transcript_62158:155-1369(-)
MVPDSEAALACGDKADKVTVVTEEELQSIYEELRVRWGRCVGLYVHGSTIFFNKEPKDLDMLAIVDQPKKFIDSGSKEAQFIVGRCEVSVYERDFWLSRLEAMDMTMLTCISTPKSFVPMEIQDDRVRNLKISLDVLEESVASFAEYTWLKAFRKMDGHQDLYAGGKNCYFVFRLLSFGCQVAERGRIADLRAANSKYETILQVFEVLELHPGDWDLVEAVFGNLVKTEVENFRQRVKRVRDTNTALADVGGELARHSGSQESAAESRNDEGNEGEHRESEHACALCREPVEMLWWPQAGTFESDDQILTAGVPLANCGHCFHVQCIVNAIRCSARSKKSGAFCPVCQQKIRLNVNKHRAFELWASRPPEGDAQGLRGQLTDSSTADKVSCGAPHKATPGEGYA